MTPEAIKIADPDSATDSIAVFPAPDTTITGPILDVSATTDFRADTIHDVSEIEFEGSAAATATFKATQFGGHRIASNATIVGNSHADTIKVDVGHDQTFNGSHLQFSNWTSSDVFDIDPSNGGFTIIGTSGNDVINLTADDFQSFNSIDGGGGSDTLKLSGAPGGSVTFSSSTLQNIGKIDLAAGADYDLEFQTGVVAAGKTMTIDATAVGANYGANIYLAEDTSGIYVVKTGAGNDTVTLNGQTDTVISGSGSTEIEYLGGELPKADRIDGGDLVMSGNYSGGYSFSSHVTALDGIDFDSGNSYRVTLDNAMDSGGLYVNGQNVGAGDSLIVNASHVTEGGVTFYAGSGLDEFTGGAEDNSFYFIGADLLTAADRVTGNGNGNELFLEGDYSSGLKFGATTISDIQDMVLENGNSAFNYNLTLHAGNVAAGHSMEIDASELDSTDTFTLNASKLTTGSLSVDGSAGNDTIVASGAETIISGGGGADVMTANGTQTVFQYGAVSDSTSAAHDNIIDFNASTDQFTLDFSLSSPHAINAAVNSGHLGNSNFNGDLASAIGASQLHAHDAVLFTPNSGDLAGHAFLIVDENGTAGYQANKDLVIELTNATNLSHFSLSDFVT